MQQSHQKMVDPRDIAGKAEEEQEEETTLDNNHSMQVKSCFQEKMNRKSMNKLLKTNL